MKIEIGQLRAVSEKLFSHLEEQGIQYVEISADYYWNVSPDQLYNPYQQPTEINIGQLTDDWKELQNLLTSGSQPLTYYFVWLAAVLRGPRRKHYPLSWHRLWQQNQCLH